MIEVDIPEGLYCTKEAWHLALVQSSIPFGLPYQISDEGKKLLGSEGYQRAMRYLYERRRGNYSINDIGEMLQGFVDGEAERRRISAALHRQQAAFCTGTAEAMLTGK